MKFLIFLLKGKLEHLWLTLEDLSKMGGGTCGHLTLFCLKNTVKNALEHWRNDFLWMILICFSMVSIFDRFSWKQRWQMLNTLQKYKNSDRVKSSQVPLNLIFTTNFAFRYS